MIFCEKFFCKLEKCWWKWRLIELTQKKSKALHFKFRESEELGVILIFKWERNGSNRMLKIILKIVSTRWFLLILSVSFMEALLWPKQQNLQSKRLEPPIKGLQTPCRTAHQAPSYVFNHNQARSKERSHTTQPQSFRANSLNWIKRRGRKRAWRSFI